MSRERMWHRNNMLEDKIKNLQAELQLFKDENEKLELENMVEFAWLQRQIEDLYEIAQDLLLSDDEDRASSLFMIIGEWQDVASRMRESGE